MPVHSVELTHLLLLNIDIQDSGLCIITYSRLYLTHILLGFGESSFGIINSDTDGDFDIEKILSLADKHGRKLDVQLNYV